MSQLGKYASLNAPVESLTGDIGGPIAPVAGNIDLLGGTNINTAGTPGTITFNLDNSISLSGTIDAVGDITSSGGDIEATLGNFLAPAGFITVNLDVTAGNDLIAGNDCTVDQNLTVTNGDILVSAGTITSLGKITSSGGDIEATSGDFIALAGGVDVAANVDAGVDLIAGNDCTVDQDLTVTNGDIDVSLGVINSLGTITSSAGDIVSSTGSVTAGDTVEAVNNITTSTGDIISTLGAGSFATSVTAGNDLHVLAGGADIVGTVEFSDLTAGTMRTSAAGVISALADGNDGTLLIGKTGDVPIWATLTAGTNIGIVEAANSITISSPGIVASITGGTNINVTGTAEDPVVNLDATITLTTVNATTFDTNVAAAGVTLSGTSLIADGTDANIDINITPKGTGVLATTELTLVTDLAVQYGGTGVSTLTQYGVLVGNAATDIQALAVGSTNQVLLGNTGANPSWGAVDLTTDITGVLPIANGGTNASSMANTYGVNYFDGTRLVTTTVGTATYVLTSNGPGVAPTFQSATGNNTVFHTDSGDATESSDAITIAGTANEIETSGAGATVTIGLPNAITLTTVNATTFDTNVAAAGVTLAGTSLLADGSDANIDINITAKGSGQVIIDDLQLTTDLEVQYGGTGASTLTDNGLLYGNGTSAIAALAEASNGQIPIGSTGNQPTLATLTEGVGIDITNAAGSITVASTGTTLNDQTGTSYTLVLTDAGKFITFTNAAAITVTVPTNAAVAFPIGTQIGFQQGGAGQVTFSGAVPPTLKSADDAYTTVKLYSCGALIKIASDVWAIAGDMEA